MVTPKVYFNRDPLFMVGPLGYWEVGDRIEGSRDTLVVCNVDLDGMAWAWRESFVFKRGEAVSENENLSEAETMQRGMEALKVARTPSNTLTDAQAEQCRRIAARGRQLRESHA